MRFKQRHRAQTPELNLVPMLDVLMVVLTFFIIVSMTLTTQQGVQVQLPAQDDGTQAEPQPKVAVVKVNSQGQLSFDDQSIAAANLTAAVKNFIQEHPKGFVVLQANETVPYEQVVTLLSELKKTGGERVSLAVE